MRTDRHGMEKHIWLSGTYPASISLSPEYHRILEGEEGLVMAREGITTCTCTPTLFPFTCLIQDPDDRQRHVQILHVFMSCYKYYLVLQNSLRAAT